MINLSDYSILGDKWLYNLLSKERQEIFPTNYKLIFLYTQDIFNNDLAIGKALLRLQEYLSILDIPNFFIELKTNKQDIQNDLTAIKNIFTPNDVEIRYTVIEGEFKKIIAKQDSLCILPWLHLHINSQGKIGACCQFDENYPLGYVSKDNLKDIVNSDKMKTVRRQMLAGQRPDICNNCWRQEDQNIISLRQQTNIVFNHHMNLVEKTTPDGEFADFKLRSFDFRTSNVCNLRCRSCSGKYSSRIAQEEIDLYPNIYSKNNFVELKLNADEISNVLDFVNDSIVELEHIYFAGGEPLIMFEHYKILDFLLANNRTDVKLAYNTNLSTLTYKKKSILDYWRQFADVTVLASIDFIGERAEYARSGVAYSIIEENYMAIRDYVKVKIDSTLTIYNTFNLIDLQRHWIKTFNMPADNFNIRIATLPPEILSCQILPKPYKQRVSAKILEHIDWLSTVNQSENLANKWQEVLYFMNSNDLSHLLKDFFRLNDDKDRIRNEKFEDIFPEFRDLRSYV